MTDPNNAGDLTPKSSTGSTVAKGCGYGCLGVFGFGSLIVGGFLQNYTFFILALVITAVIIFATRADKKKATTESVNAIPAAEAPVMQPTPDTSSSSGALASPICSHRFDSSSFNADGLATCSCGNTFRRADLELFQDLNQQRQALFHRIENLVSDIRVFSVSSGVSQRTAASSAEAAPAVKPAKIKPVRPKRGRTEVSLQQWLIIGAAALVMIAGVVFVSANIDTMDQWVFQLITVVVAGATAFGAFKLKNFSVLLSNFLALFSSAMQLATMTIVADQLDGSFEWPNLTSLWWSISLLVVGGMSVVLSRLSKNFGWKAIAVINLTATGLIFVMGTLREWLIESTFIYSTTLIAFTAFMVGQVLVSRTVRGFKAEIPKGENSAYLIDVSNREDLALRRYALSATSLFALLSVGYSLYLSLLSSEAMKNIWEPWTTILFGAIWVVLAKYVDFWGGEFTEKGKTHPTLEKTSWILGLGAMAMGTSNLATKDVDSNLLSIVISLVGISLISLLTKFVKWVSATAVSIDVALWVSIGTFLLWKQSLWELGTIDLAIYLLGSAVLLSVNAWLRERKHLVVAGSLMGQLAVVSASLSLVLDTASNTPAWLVSSVGLTVAAVLGILQSKISGSKSVHWLQGAFTWPSLVSSAVMVGVLVSDGWYVYMADSWGPIAILLTYGLVALLAWKLAGKGKDSNSVSSVSVHYGLTQVGLLTFVAQNIAHRGHYELLMDSLVLLIVAGVNYAAAAVLKLKGLALPGYVVANLAGIAYIFSLTEISELWVTLAVAIGLSIALPLVHFNVSHRLSGKFTHDAWLTPIIGSVAIVGFGFTQTWWYRLEEPVIYSSLISAGALTMLLWFELLRGEKNQTQAKLAGGLALIYAVANIVASTTFMVSVSSSLIQVWSFLLLSVIVARLNLRKAQNGWVALGIISNLAGAVSLMQLFPAIWPDNQFGEIYSLAISASITVSALVYGKQLGKAKNFLLTDLPVLIPAFASLSIAVSSGFWLESSQIREIFALSIIAGYAYWRSAKAKSVGWLSLGYVAGAGSSLVLVSEIATKIQFEWHGGEFHALALAGSILVGHAFLKRIRKVTSVDLLRGLPLAVLVVATFSSGINNGLGSFEGLLRVSIALVVASVYVYWRTAQTSGVAWLIAGYVLGAASATALAEWFKRYVFTTWDGPEVYSLLITASIFVGHRFLRKVSKSESTLVLWGLPTSAAILPSAIYTSTTAELAFSALNTAQISRALAVLLVSGAVMLLGLRSGNRGLVYSGIAGLSILGWFHASLVAPAATGEFRAIVLAAVLVSALGALKKAGKIRGNSIIWIGIPVAVAMSPAIYNSLMALSNPTLTSVDWWRFGIVVTASIILLVAGSLREIAGMFFPGLVGVLLAALPYGFKRVQEESWFLWVLLLLIAGIMVWIAVRMDQLRKKGKSSADWLKELK